MASISKILSSNLRPSPGTLAAAVSIQDSDNSMFVHYPQKRAADSILMPLVAIIELPS